jgi:hypothetical protein
VVANKCFQGKRFQSANAKPFCVLNSENGSFTCLGTVRLSPVMPLISRGVLDKDVFQSKILIEKKNVKNLIQKLSYSYF